MAESTAPAAGPLEALEAAHQRLRETDQRIMDERLRLAESAKENAVNLARLEIATILMALVRAKVAIGKPTPEERKVDMIAKLISQRSGGVTREELLTALGSFQATPDTQE